MNKPRGRVRARRRIDDAAESDPEQAMLEFKAQFSQFQTRLMSQLTDVQATHVERHAQYRKQLERQLGRDHPRVAAYREAAAADRAISKQLKRAPRRKRRGDEGGG